MNFNNILDIIEIVKRTKKNAWLCKEGLSKNKHMNMRKQVYAILRNFHRHFKIVLIDY